MVQPSSPPLDFITIPRDERKGDYCTKHAMIISPKTERIICTREEDYRRWTWEEVKEAVRIHRIDLFQRTPNDAKQYVEFVHSIKESHGSILRFMQRERLGWSASSSAQASSSSTRPLDDPDGYKISYNDWPYGLELAVVHLVVWTKFQFEEDESVTGELTKAARAQIEQFVERTFCGEDGVSGTDLVWFRNCKALKSVHAVEHFHVMLREPGVDFLARITHGDRPKPWLPASSSSPEQQKAITKYLSHQHKGGGM